MMEALLMHSRSTILKSKHLNFIKPENRLYQRFTKFSYFAANSALNFWRELLKKNIDSQVLLDRGAEISKIHTKLKDTANEIQKLAQNDIKFLFQYSTFLF